MYWRPDSAHTNVIAPSVRSRAISGTTIAEFICSSRTSRRCSSSSAAASISAASIIGYSSGAAGADHVRRAGWGVRIRRVTVLELARPADLVGVDVRHGGLLAGRELHRAPVGEPRDGELGDLLERVDRIHRRGEHLARGVEERVCLLALAALGDVTEQPGDALGLPVRPADGARACVQPALAAVGQRDPQVELVGGAVADRFLDQPAQRHAVIGMDDPLEEVVDARGLCAARESVERAHVV